MRYLIPMAVVMLGLTAQAGAEAYHFTGPHPVAPTVVKGMCFIEGPHIHSYEPHKKVLYVQVGGAWSFVGDPVEFEPEGPKHSYYGHHPVFWVDTPDTMPDDIRATHYCYISGPHHHWYAPRAELSFTTKGGAYWFVGAPPRWYRARWRRHSPIDDYYGTAVVVRPVITVEPPDGFVGIYLGPGHHHERGRGHVHGGVFVTPPRVNVGISFGGGGGPVYVGGHKFRAGHDETRRGHGPPGHAPAWGARGVKGGGGGHGKGGRHK